MDGRDERETVSQSVSVVTLFPDNHKAREREYIVEFFIDACH